MNFSYDDSADVLYVTFEYINPKKAKYVECERGNIFKLHPDDLRIVGVTIPFFVKRAATADASGMNVSQIGRLQDKWKDSQ